MTRENVLDAGAGFAMRREDSRRESETPIIGPRGQLTYHDRTVYLSERDALLASVLLYHLGAELTDLQLLERVFPDGATSRTLRVHLRRLDRRLARVGLTVVEGANQSYALLSVEPVDACMGKG